MIQSWKELLEIFKVSTAWSKRHWKGLVAYQIITVVLAYRWDDIADFTVKMVKKCKKKEAAK